MAEVVALSSVLVGVLHRSCPEPGCSTSNKGEERQAGRIAPQIARGDDPGDDRQREAHHDSDEHGGAGSHPSGQVCMGVRLHPGQGELGRQHFQGLGRVAQDTGLRRRRRVVGPADASAPLRSHPMRLDEWPVESKNRRRIARSRLVPGCLELGVPGSDAGVLLHGMRVGLIQTNMLLLMDLLETLYSAAQLLLIEEAEIVRTAHQPGLFDHGDGVFHIGLQQGDVRRGGDAVPENPSQPVTMLITPPGDLVVIRARG